MAGSAPARKPRQKSGLRSLLRTGPLDRVRRVVRGVHVRRVARDYAVQHNSAVGVDALTLNFHPQLPSPRAHIGPICRQLGIRIGDAPGAPDATIAWHTGTWLPARAARDLPASAINTRCVDVSKTRVAAAWEEVAGYPLEIDPLTAEGPIVVKSELQGRHDGRVMVGPLDARRRGMVYQRLIDGRRGDQVVVQRTVVIGPEIPVVFDKGRSASDPFGHTVWSAARRVEDVYAPGETVMLLHFARLLHLEYGELDVMRDSSSGLIYVVDANRTPMAAPGVLEPEDMSSMALMAESFGRLMSTRMQAP